MKIAVTYENNQIFQHFGHTKQFKIYNKMKKVCMSQGGTSFWLNREEIFNELFYNIKN